MSASKIPDWSYTQRFSDVAIASEFNLTPDKFWQASYNSRVYMVAYTRVKGTMSAWEEHVRPKPKKSASPTRSSRGRSSGRRSRARRGR